VIARSNLRLKREGQGLREATVSEHVLVTDAEGKSSTSASGRMAHSTEGNQKHAGKRPAAKLFPSRVAMKPCVTIVGRKFGWCRRFEPVLR
jgi:hypothetical protein